jgi:hypothetical protein
MPEIMPRTMQKNLKKKFHDENVTSHRGNRDGSQLFLASGALYPVPQNASDGLSWIFT